MLSLPPFRPHWLFRGGHLQTLAGCFWSGPAPAYRARRHTLALPDGDALILHDDAPPDWRPGDRVALLTHGLGGSHRSAYVARTAERLQARGVRVFRLDLRGQGAGAGLARLPAHAGRSEDLAAALARVSELCPESPVALVGYSLGANMTLKLAGEFGAQPPPALERVLAVAPPIDLARCCRNLARGWNRLYDAVFLRGCLQAARRKHAGEFASLWTSRSGLPRRLQEFDDWYTAPRSGFAGAEDYYARASSGPWLTKIAVPTLILAAADDPIVPVACFEEARCSPATTLVVTEHGGHLGYVSAAPSASDPDHRWLDWRIVEWVAGAAGV